MSKTELFIQLENELKRYQKVMTEAADIILEQDVTRYPIFVAHQQEVEIGIPITKLEGGEKWAIHASSLEEFVSKQIIFPEKIEEFKRNYKEAKDSICIFVLSELGAQFVFIPRK